MFSIVNIVILMQCNGCIKTCLDDQHECYVIDHNGYIVISYNVNHTGTFFGEHHGDVMATLVEKEIYLAIKVFDYQALCKEKEEVSSSFAYPRMHVGIPYIKK